MPLKEWARRKNRELHRQALEDRDSHLWHSSSYHRYFEGYTEYKELDTSGKERLRRVYTGTWYIQDLPRNKAILLRVLYVILFLLMLGALVIAGIMQGSAGTAFYIVLPELALICLLAYLLYTLAVNYLFSPQKLTIHGYHASSTAVKRAGFGLTAAFLVSFLATLLDALLGQSSRFQNLPLTLAAFLFGAAFALLLRWIESHIPYREEENGIQVTGIGIENDLSE